MTTSYPSGLDSYTNPTATDELDDEVGTRTHSEFHADNNDAIEAIQAELGTLPKGAAANVGARILATETVANAALPTATAATTYQPLDSDLTAIAALSTTAYGRAVLALANQAALSALVDHGGVGGLSDDDHSQYVLVAGTRSTAQVVLQAGNAAHVPLIAKGAASQSANLQEWQDSAGVVQASVTNAGSVQASFVQNPAFSGPYVNVSTSGIYVIARDNAAYVPLIARGMAAQSGNLQSWQNSAGTVLASVSAGGLLDFAESAGDKILLYGTTFGIGIETNAVTQWSAVTHRWRVGGSSVSAGTEAMALTGSALTLADTVNISVSGTVGTKIGTQTYEKLGFWNATPVVQPTNVTNPTGGATVDAEARTAIDAILSRLETIGLFAA